MARKRPAAKATAVRAPSARPSALLDTRIIYCGDCLDQLAKLPDGCVDLIYIDPPFNSNRNYEVFWGETMMHAQDDPIIVSMSGKEKTKRFHLRQQMEH